MPFLHDSRLLCQSDFLIAPAVLMLVGAVATAEVRAAQDPIALPRTGTAAIENQRFGDALEAFTKAAALQPGDASHLLWCGRRRFHARAE